MSPLVESYKQGVHPALASLSSRCKLVWRAFLQEKLICSVVWLISTFKPRVCRPEECAQGNLICMPVSRTNIGVLEFEFINKDVMAVTFVLNGNIFRCYVFYVTYINAQFCS